MQVSGSNPNNFLPPLMRQAGESDKGKQKALPPTPPAPQPAPVPTPDTLKPSDSMKQLQQQRIHSAFAAVAQSEGSSNAIVQAKKTEQELLKRLEAGSSDPDKLNLEAAPLPGGWPRRRNDRSRVHTSPLDWQGLQSHSDDTNFKLIILVNAISQAADNRVGPHITTPDLNTNPRVMSTLHEYVQTARENHVQPHTLSHILNHLINN